MKKIYILAVTAFVCLAACGDGLNLPPIGVETDLNKIPLPDDDTESLMEIPLKPTSEPMIHCGALHTPEDFQRIKENMDKEPWKSGLELLRASWHAQLSYNGNPQTSIKRGVSGDENYSAAMKDAASAYQMGLRYHLGDGDAYADKAIEIMHGWATTCTLVTGNTNSALAAGLYGYEFAVAGELLRDYWIAKDPDGFAAYQQWMIDVFYTANHEFLVNHFGTPPLHYWANWGLCNLASILAIGILTDRRDLYNEAVEHLQTGETSGRMTNAIYHVFDGEYANLAQWQESGRDAGHTFLCQGLMGTICQLTWNQGDDFFGYNDNMYLKGCEYNGRYHVAGLDVPYEPYTREYKGNWGIAYEEHPEIAPRGGAGGPIWALAYYHYSKIKGVDAEKYKYTTMGMNLSFPEGGGGNYGSNSGGYDHLGFGTLMYAR
ncbi:alginate lyase family protein [uncultured Bacteroides sp.]|jgi:hypothetical protein|uniref:alginate lyase family protein n=1 Tax=uncultured Bacteroides sp. TaxID=162156 RepID=UPI00280A8451|nr:alginate lyase family protein [uncultured Bacteroides sp.]